MINEKFLKVTFHVYTSHVFFTSKPSFGNFTNLVTGKQTVSTTLFASATFHESLNGNTESSNSEKIGFHFLHFMLAFISLSLMVLNQMMFSSFYLSTFYCCSHKPAHIIFLTGTDLLVTNNFT